MDNLLRKFHDAELNIVKHDRKASTVCLTFVNLDGTIEEVAFNGVRAFRVVDYGPQNVVSRLLSSSLPGHLSSKDIFLHVTWINSTIEGKCLVNKDAIDKLVEQVEKNDLILFILEPSWGAEISILARAFFLS